MTEKEVRISSSEAVNALARQQEESLQTLINCIDSPFPSFQAYLAWQRNAITLQLSHCNDNHQTLDRLSLFQYLIKNYKDMPGTSDTEKKQFRQIVITIIHHHLVETFSQAKTELAKREANNDPI